MKKNTLILLPIIFIFLACAAVFSATHVLTDADKPVQSDAVILFLGSDDRKKEANRLLEEGYADYLIIPAFKQVFTHKHIPVRVPYARKVDSSGAYPGFYENTHVEVLQAKEIMNAMGLQSALMVSSSYHMKRIRIITESVFGDQAQGLRYVPARYEQVPEGFPDVLTADWAFIASELIKICWFYLYAPFSAD